MYNSEDTAAGFHFSNPAIIHDDDAEFLALLGGGQGSKTPTYPLSSSYILQNLANNNTTNNLNPTTSAEQLSIIPPSPPEPSSSSSESPPSASISTTNINHPGTAAAAAAAFTAAGSNPSLTDLDDFQNTGYYRDVPMASRATRSTHRDPQTGEPGQKRKVLDDLDSDDSDEDAPLRKVQHTDIAAKKGAAKRKSISTQDESRLQKRKEQNRAAQRAFRERKERHVKDLEDKVAMLEEKTDTQAAENDNLRELLTRLQQENSSLRQNQFNFTFQQPFASTSASAAGPQGSSAASSSRQPQATDPLSPHKSNLPSSSQPSATDMGMLSRMMSSGSSSSSSSSLNVNSLTAAGGGNRPKLTTPQLSSNTSPPAEFTLLDSLGVPVTTPDLSFSATSAPLAGLTPPSSNNFTLMDTSFLDSASGFGSTAAAGTGVNGGPSTVGSSNDFTMFGDFPSSFAPMPYQTIAANPMYTSYRDPSANPNAWASFGPNQSQGLALSMYDELFGGAGLSSGGTPTTAVGSTSYPAPGSIPLDDSSLSQMGNVGANMNGTAGGLVGMDDLIPFSFMPDLTGAGGSQFSGLSPISHLPTPPSASTATGNSTPGGGKVVGVSGSGSPLSSSSTVAVDHVMASPNKKEGWTGESCPKTKEEFAQAIEETGMSVFPTTSAAPPAASARSGDALLDALTDKSTCAAKPIPMADATKLNLDIGTAWRAVRQHPQFEECDIDELCAELAQKATCDGTSKVIEAQQIMDLVHSIPERAKQRKMNLSSRPVA